jgi:glutamate synthase (NADPH/NADH) small chain
MPSSCPKCHRVLEEDEICCAQVRYSWRCQSCFKLTTGFAVPYGKCFMCGGELTVIPDRDLGDCMRFHAIRDAMQFGLNSFHFFKLARERATTPEQCIVLEHLYEAGLDHVYELEEKYHAHLDWEMVEFASDEEKLLSDWSFRGIRVKQDAGIADLYRVALETEPRAREHFRQLASQFPVGLDNELCREVAAEEEEHVAMLQTELEQLT